MIRVNIYMYVLYIVVTTHYHEEQIKRKGMVKRKLVRPKT